MSDSIISSITGLAGALTGLLTVVFTFVQYKSQKPKVEIIDVVLRLPQLNSMIKPLEIGAEFLRKENIYKLGIVVEITMSNKNQTSGSIMKPQLIISSNQKEIILSPKIEYPSSKQSTIEGGILLPSLEIRPSYINVPGYGFSSERIDYEVFNVTHIIWLLQNLSNVNFSIRHLDHRGKKITTLIKE